MLVDDGMLPELTRDWFIEALDGRVAEVAVGTCSSGTLNWDRGRDSRLAPKTEFGARARTEAFVSAEVRRLWRVEEARVRVEASSVSTLFAVAVE